MEVKVKSDGILFPVHSEEKAFVYKTSYTLTFYACFYDLSA